MKGLEAKRALREQVPVERFHVPDVKNNAVALGDRPVVDRVFANDAKYFVSAFACVYEAGVEVMTDADSTSGGSHACSPPIGCGFRSDDASKIGRPGSTVHYYVHSL